MTSKADTRATLMEQQKSVNLNKDTCNCKPSPLQITKVSKSEPASPKQVPGFGTQNQSKHTKTQDLGVQASPFHKRGDDGLVPSNDYLKQVTVLDSGKLEATFGAMEKLQVTNVTVAFEEGADQEKKISGKCSFKDSFTSAKISDGNNSFTKTSGSAKVSDRAEFVESGKSSLCRGSTSSDVSDESTCSSLSSRVYKPHKANDSRWEAIQAVRTRDGVLGLNQFRLLKRLGCGDIGSVYLSELSGTKCYFAMKVMDKGSLASRKKLLRAQTEREILQSLDHPFLPTLYTHFETDKFSCLVMEFCPGGDLHTLRQRQPGKHFSEQAVKYVHFILYACYIQFAVGNLKNRKFYT